MIACPHPRLVAATVGVGAAVAALAPDVRYWRRLRVTSQQLREQLAADERGTDPAGRPA